MASQNLIEVLRKARDLLSQPGAWTKGHLARDGAGYPVDPLSGDGACFCIVGAIDFITRDNHEMHDAARSELRKGMSGIGLASFNDSQDTVEPVLELFDKAIARLESEAAP
jgi:hypothetical protein